MPNGLSESLLSIVANALKLHGMSVSADTAKAIKAFATSSLCSHIRSSAPTWGNKMTYDYDVLVIGAGQGGLPAAHMAATLGARVALIEQAEVGGT